MENSKSKRSRRTFLLAVGAGGAATVAAIAAKTVPDKPEASAKKAPEGESYRLSEHIRRYYRTTLV
jgi:succinate dehydrogenase/fumarate reductase flavoprotein subunit